MILEITTDTPEYRAITLAETALGIKDLVPKRTLFIGDIVRIHGTLSRYRQRCQDLRKAVYANNAVALICRILERHLDE